LVLGKNKINELADKDAKAVTKKKKRGVLTV
jgi:hypothetical protein